MTRCSSIGNCCRHLQVCRTFATQLPHSLKDSLPLLVLFCLPAGGGESFNELTTVCFFKKPAMPKQKDELKINCYTLSEVC